MSNHAPLEANWPQWFAQHDHITIRSPDDEPWANEACGLPRWTVWAWCGRSGGVVAWCNSEGSARFLADALMSQFGVPDDA